MKKLLVIAIGLLIGFSAMAEIITVSTTPVQVKPNEAYKGWCYFYSIINKSGSTVFVKANIEPGQMIVTNSIPIPPGFGYSMPLFGPDGRAVRIQNVVLVTESGSSEVYISFE